MSCHHILFCSLVLPSIIFAEAGPAINVPSNAIFYAELDDFSQIREALSKTPVGGLIVSDQPAVSVSMLMGVGKLFLPLQFALFIGRWGAARGAALLFAGHATLSVYYFSLALMPVGFLQSTSSD